MFLIKMDESVKMVEVPFGEVAFDVLDVLIFGISAAVARGDMLCLDKL
ncbi:hypothetical protein [Halalkalibacter kiskunsagensis]